MSQIIVNIPECATYADNSTRDSQQSNTITVDTSNCPAPPPNPAPMIDTWGIIIIAAVAVVLFVSTAIVRYRAHELKPQRIEAQNNARKIELDAEVQMAALRKRCGTCGDVYEPELEKQ